MALSFQYRARGCQGGRVALFPGAWNPPTVAHLAIARAAFKWADEVVWVLPRAFPHKPFEGAGFDDRLRMLRLIAEGEPCFSVAVAEGGLYVEMAGEASDFYGPATKVGLLCGRDAAERIAAWDYGTPGVFDQMIQRYPLLVAGRAGAYLPAAHHARQVIVLPMEESFDEVSSTEVRARVRQGLGWRDLVPDAIAGMVEHLY
jgi:nicotinate (nicotinamide) nucleotide adenylyltransferase